MKILVINCGSSSLKFQLIDSETEELTAKGLCERIGIAGSRISYTLTGHEKRKWDAPMADHKDAVRLMLQTLTNPEDGAVKELSEIGAVGHRVVHGGEHFSEATLITPQVKEAIMECTVLAPLHNPANLQGIEDCELQLPGVPQVAVFDTAFHQTMDEEAYLYAIPYRYYKQFGIRRYGFHGTSHRYVARIGAELAGLDFENSKIITCHIGNGASVTAVLNGKSFDTSMGFSPLDGLVMGTRCGSVDASAVTYIGEKEGMTYAELNEMMNKRSGVLGLTGLSSDMRDIDRAYDEGNPEAILARDMHYRRIKKFVGEYAAEMGGVDLIVFTGGVGENSSEMRESVCEGLEFMGVHFDKAANQGARGVNKMLSTPDSKVKVAMIATNEELVIATDTYNLVK